eukprot:TRINITY_DN9387_c0_g1_i9.p1 TRINITY_DN9387_c0_g1~~TRINITY_DN9387_c0_g1_i9.p1  ORF type:complete len:189 (+),score=17.31 TRINITY_DN9387_c0_g1_i9:61-567(+)
MCIRDRSFTKISDQGFRAFAGSSNCRKIQHLVLNGRNLTDETVEAILNSDGFDELKELHLEEQNIADKSLEIISTNDKFFDLVVLNLRKCFYVSDKGWLILSSRISKDFPDLKKVRVSRHKGLAHETVRKLALNSVFEISEHSGLQLTSECTCISQLDTVEVLQQSDT